MQIQNLKTCACVLASAAAFAAVTVLSPLEARAAECGSHAKVTAFLGKKYKEQVAAMGLVSNKGFMQLFVAETGTWTVLLTTPEGISCIVAAGDSYEKAPVVANDPNA